MPVVSVGGWELWKSRGGNGLFVAQQAHEQDGRRSKRRNGNGDVLNTPSTGSEDEDGWREIAAEEEGRGEVNGESVREGLVTFRKEMGVKALAYGFGWVLGLVGIWGDGF